jgi:hypothetical protein
MHLRVLSVVCLLFLRSDFAGLGQGHSTFPHAMPPAIATHTSSQTLARVATVTAAAMGSHSQHYLTDKDS